MNVSCPECRSVFRIDPVKVADAGVRARCNVCGAVMAVARARVQDPALAAEPPISSTIHVAAPSELAEPTAAAVERAGAAGAHGDAKPNVDTTATMTISQPAAPATVPTRDGLVPSMAPTSFEEMAAGQIPLAPNAQPVSEARPRPVNPYLNNTPELRARRLARALVSDLVAYNPQKREQGLRDGTLRQLFRDEIRKSWDEYVEQVGASVAESTPHFQDALNDVLAGGRRVF